MAVIQSPQDEATELFSQVLRDLTSPNRDLVVALRRCYLACQVLNWSEQRAWFQRELEGYPVGSTIPPYRRVRGQLVWRIPGEIRVALELAVAEVHLGRRHRKDVEVVTLDVRGGVDWVSLAARSGYSEPTDETAEDWSSSLKRAFTWTRVREFGAASFAAVLAEIEKVTFGFASQAYTFLRYGNALTDIWQDYRRDVDAKLLSIGFGGHLDTIQVGLRSDNPTDWRAATFACRSLLEDVAAYLWRDPRKTYEYLPGSEPDAKGNLKVSKDRPVNRLTAYIHQKGLHGDTGKLIRDEIQRLEASIRSLVARQGEAHTPITREDARAIAITTYVVLGELATRTDMAPIEKYGRPTERLEGETSAVASLS